MSSKLRRGTRDPNTGRTFWAYGKNYPNGEYWATPEVYQSLLDKLKQRRACLEGRKHIRELEKARRAKPEHKAKAKAQRCAERQDPEKGPILRARIKANLDARPTKAKVIKCGARDFKTGKVFWAYSKGSKDGEYWVSPEQFKRLRDRQTETHQARMADPKKLAQARAARQVWLTQKGGLERMAAGARSRRKSCAMFALAGRLRCRVGGVIRRMGFAKQTPTQQLVGCDWVALREWIEGQFKEGMSWENRSLWQIDHVIPLASASNEEELLLLFHYTNLQPLWEKDNKVKGAKMPNC